MILNANCINIFTLNTQISWNHKYLTQGWGEYWTYEYEYWKIFSIFMFIILYKMSTRVVHVLSPALIWPQYMYMYLVLTAICVRQIACWSQRLAGNWVGNTQENWPTPGKIFKIWVDQVVSWCLPAVCDRLSGVTIFTWLPGWLLYTSFTVFDFCHLSCCSWNVIINIWVLVLCSIW